MAVAARPGGKHASLFIGGSGDAGGAGGAVGIEQGSTGIVETKDKHSVGILGQSVGGGGGNGANSEGLFIAVGGHGGEGGDGGAVLADLDGEVTTHGDFSSAVVLQSIGGGGGHGGNSTAWGEDVSIGIGGSGGKGGTGGDVAAYVASSGKISTAGKDSSGLHLQSIGGGGGNGGTATSKESGDVVTISTSIGGSGGVAGDGGDILAENDGTITLTNKSGNSSALYAQSIGGGGGHGGSTTAKSHDSAGDPESLNVEMTLSIGGSGGAAGDGGDVALVNTGVLQLAGDLGVGMFGQSIGGGGGAGGKSSLAAALKDATGDYAQFSLSVGGSGGGGGLGGVVALANGSSSHTDARITTLGHSSIGMLAQSVGGGGGHGGSGNVDVDDKSDDDDDDGGGDDSVSSGDDDDEPTQTYELSLQIGGSDGTTGNGGTAEAENFGNIETAGDSSAGVTVQSIGGGGGVLRDTDSKLTAKSNTVDIQVGSSDNKAGGFGGDASVENHGLITTVGGDSAGIIAQSIAGGGGDVGKGDSSSVFKELEALGSQVINSENEWSATVSMGSTVSDSQGSGQVNVVTAKDSNVLTTGNRSIGILAQGVAGGGGKSGVSSAISNAAYVDSFDDSINHRVTLNVGAWHKDSGKGVESSANSATSTVSVVNEGNIETLGYAAPGLIAQEIAGGGGVANSGAVDVNSVINLGMNLEGQNYAGVVNVEQAYGSILTAGHHSIGILAQSISGGGGYATSGGIPVTPSTYSGTAFLRTTTAQLGVTENDQHAGVIHGPGGRVSVSLGGDDTSDISSNVATAGDWSFGVVAQSLGLGGGVAQTVVGANSTAYETFDVQLGAGIGHDDNGGGPVFLGASEDSVIYTQGYGSAGLVLQSVGAGGGIFTSNSSDYRGQDFADGTTNGYGYNYKDVVLGAGDQSLSGGDQKDISGAGGAIVADGVKGKITTEGMYAHGAVFQSIGGGGGIFGAGKADGDFTGEKVRVQLGGFTDASIEDGMEDISLSDVNFIIETSGDQAHGFITQSISNGGGIAMGENIDNHIANSQLGSNQKGTSDHNAADVSVELGADSSITTHGDQAHGVIVQSIGGGGGILSAATVTEQFAANTNQFVQTNTHGYSGDVSVTSSGSITVSGDGAVGIIAQSISGGGGIFGHLAGSWGDSGSSTGKGGTVTVINSSSGVIDALGSSSNGIGIFAQAVAANGSGGDTISVTNSGKIVVDMREGSAIVVDGGNSDNTVSGSLRAAGASTNNVVHNHGTIVGKTAVHYTGEALVDVHNHGHIQGSVRLNEDESEGGTGVLYNYNEFMTGDEVVGHVNNSGDLYVGTSSSSGGVQTIFHDSISNSETGTLYFDLFGLGNHDNLTFHEDGLGEFFGFLVVVIDDEFLPKVNDTFELIQGVDDHFFHDDFLASLRFENAVSGLEGNLSKGEDQSLWLNITSVPEPDTFALILSALTLSLVLTRRRR